VLDRYERGRADNQRRVYASPPFLAPAPRPRCRRVAALNCHHTCCNGTADLLSRATVLATDNSHSRRQHVPQLTHAPTGRWQTLDVAGSRKSAAGRRGTFCHQSVRREQHHSRVLSGYRLCCVQHPARHIALHHQPGSLDTILCSATSLLHFAHRAILSDTA
jgi:hypothetical protein